MATRDIQVTISCEEVSGYVCASCGFALGKDDDLDPKYECGSCGSEFTRSESADGDSHRCPYCNKFGAKTFDAACPECGEGMDPGLALVCPKCDELRGEDSMAEHYIECAL